VETLSEAIERLRTAGYHLDLFAEAGGRLRCGECDLLFAPDTLTVDEVVRFEGASDPDDEAILFALSATNGHRGTYNPPYGPDATPEDAVVMRALRA
jgi:hypothetical protein